MERCKALIEEFSSDIKMSFGIDKCAVIHLKRGKTCNSPKTKEIPTLGDEESYKYLGILESSSIKHNEAIEAAKNNSSGE